MLSVQMKLFSGWYLLCFQNAGMLLLFSYIVSLVVLTQFASNAECVASSLAT